MSSRAVGVVDHPAQVLVLEFAVVAAGLVVSVLERAYLLRLVLITPSQLAQAVVLKLLAVIPYSAQLHQPEAVAVGYRAALRKQQFHLLPEVLAVAVLDQILLKRKTARQEIPQVHHQAKAMRAATDLEVIATRMCNAPEVVVVRLP